MILLRGTEEEREDGGEGERGKAMERKTGFSNENVFTDSFSLPLLPALFEYFIIAYLKMQEICIAEISE